MLCHISEVLRLDYVTDSLANQSMVEINSLNLCYLILELLQRQSASGPDRAQLNHYSLRKAWKTICSSLAASVMTGIPPSDVERQKTTIQCCLSLIGGIHDLGVHSELDQPLTQLVSALRIKLLGPQIAGGISKLLSKAAGRREAGMSTTEI